jgi:hypothetical protein
MSASKCHIVFVAKSASPELARGVLRPQPLWSKSTTR